jgi:hypothetical protein
MIRASRLGLDLKFGLLGFVLGLGIAFVIARLAYTQSLSPRLIFALWPTAVFGIGATGWSDGVFFHTFQGILVFGGNGLLYGFIFYLIGMAVAALIRRRPE